MRRWRPGSGARGAPLRSPVPPAPHPRAVQAPGRRPSRAPGHEDGGDRARMAARGADPLREHDARRRRAPPARRPVPAPRRPAGLTRRPVPRRSEPSRPVRRGPVASGRARPGGRVRPHVGRCARPAHRSAQSVGASAGAPAGAPAGVRAPRPVGALPPRSSPARRSRPAWGSGRRAAARSSRCRPGRGRRRAARTTGGGR